MGEWSFIGGFFESLHAHSPMLGRFWLLLMLVFRIMILGTVASDLFEDEQTEFACNTLQPGCKQVCYDMAFPISQYRFWVFHIVLIATPSLLFLMYATHHVKKRTNEPNHTHSVQECREDRRFRRLYIVNVIFRILAEVAFLYGQWRLYGFKVEAQFPCNRFPCPYTVDCFTSRPAEKTIFLCFYFAVGVISAISSLVELFYSSLKWFSRRKKESCSFQNHHNHEEEASLKRSGVKVGSESGSGSVKMKKESQRSSRKKSPSSHKNKCVKYAPAKLHSV